MNERNVTMSYVNYLKLLTHDHTLHHEKKLQFILYR
jgi:hypothetical protein